MSVPSVCFAYEFFTLNRHLVRLIDNLTPEQFQGLSGFFGAIAKYAPDFNGPAKVDDAARVNIALWKRVSIEDGYGGAFVSHFGNKQWV